MLRRYTRGFFGLQIEFATLVSERLGLPLSEGIDRFTTIPLSLDLDAAAVAEAFGTRLASEALLDVAWRLYARRHPEEWEDLGRERPDLRLFGCFYYGLQNETTLRPHLIKNVPPGESVLGRGSAERRLFELTAMFRDVRENVPHAKAVQGNSWLYNLEAYRRLFPSTYTHPIEEASDDEFRYLALWGQFYDRDWAPKAGPAAALLAAAKNIRGADDVPGCFPLRVLRPRCSVEEFFRFYGIG